MAARSGRPPPSPPPRDTTSSPSSHRISGACRDEVVTAGASLTSLSAGKAPAEVGGGRRSTGLTRDRESDQISLVLRGISRKPPPRRRLIIGNPPQPLIGPNCAHRHR